MDLMVIQRYRDSLKKIQTLDQDNDQKTDIPRGVKLVIKFMMPRDGPIVIKPMLQ
jgi:hypothetical protein